LLTQGQVTEVNVTITVCYDIFCLSAGKFLDQVAICCAGFSDGGDSGSLIVSTDGSRKPVGLLFAGGSNRTYANRIDRVLNRFGVTIDGSTSPPPTPDPVTDLAVSGVSAPASATVGEQVSVAVTVQNTGDQTVAGGTQVTLVDATDNLTIGSGTLSSLDAGGSATLTFGWNTTGRSPGAHTLTGSHSLTDDVASNNSGSTGITLNAPPTPGMHVGDLDAGTTLQTRTWTAIVTISVHDGAHAPIAGATVQGAFTAKGSGSCITGSNGSCTISKSRLRDQSVAFSVSSVSHATSAYVPASNHDGDGDSNGTTITVTRP
jgi:hypothetical protein